MKSGINVFIVILMFMFSVGCSNGMEKKFSIGVDVRIELLATVQKLSSYSNDVPFLFNNFSFPYKNRFVEYFSKYKYHMAVISFVIMPHSI